MGLASLCKGGICEAILPGLLDRWECEVTEREGDVLVLNIVLAKNLAGSRWRLKIDQLVGIFFDVQVELLSKQIIIFSTLARQLVNFHSRFNL